MLSGPSATRANRIVTERDFHLPGRSTVYAGKAAAATSHPLATEAAIATMRAGGNAVDAAVCAAGVLCVAEPHMTGIGGDCFALVADPKGNLYGLNGSGRSPRLLTPGVLAERGYQAVDPDSAHAITVPGAVGAWAALLERHGRWGLDRALARAIDLAEQGCPVAPRVGFDWARHVERIRRDPGSAAHLLPEGRAPRAGELFRAPELAKTLRRIAERGAAEFYEGEISEAIVETCRSHGGLHTREDLASYAPDWVSPITTTYRGTEIVQLPPNTQGLAALVLLNILENFDLASLRPFGVERARIELEAARFAYLVRDELVSDAADPDALAQALDKNLGREYASRIVQSRQTEAVRRPKAAGSDTVYLTVVDADGWCVSFINSLYMAFGSGITTPRWGITLQNRGACFVTAERHPNQIGPGKRPLHTLIPALARQDGRVSLSFGVMGGAYQACGHARLVTNIVDYGMSVQAAIDGPRAFWDDAGTVRFERGYDADVVSAFGVGADWAEFAHGGAQAIQILRDSGTIAAGSDPRKDGCAMGF